jgi:hypothetical protein
VGVGVGVGEERGHGGWGRRRMRYLCVEVIGGTREAVIRWC